MPTSIARVYERLSAAAHVARASLLVAAVAIFVTVAAVAGQRSNWRGADAFDTVMTHMDGVTDVTCDTLQRSQLFLSNSTVSHLPDAGKILANPIFPNRSHLVYLHNLALSRATFFSIVVQTRVKENTNAEVDPGMMYYFLSAAADIASSPHINSSAVYFSPNTSYSPSFETNYNLTFPLFAPRAFRADDYNYPFHLERVATLNTIEVQDLGAITPDRQSLNYTSPLYRINEWYSTWLPDREKSLISKHVINVRVLYADNRNETLFIRVPKDMTGQQRPGVSWFRPYFDCGRSNKWVMGGASPVIDTYPRHTGFSHIEFPTYGAVVVIELDVDRIDVNQCAIAPGNQQPNAFAGTDRCPKTTQCEPLDGYGFRRGGYECRCQPGYRLPRSVRRPFLGEMLEWATDTDRNTRFQCERIGMLQDQITNYGEPMSAYKRRQYLGRTFYRASPQSAPPLTSTGPRLTRQPPANDVEALRKFVNSVNKDNCKSFSASDLVLPDDVLFGAERQFEVHARLALRLANFISAFLQVSNPNELFSGTRLPDPPLSQSQMIAEVLSLVMGDDHLRGAGVMWRRARFAAAAAQGRQLFAPYAYRTRDDKFEVEDLARRATPEHSYLNDALFRKVQTRWASNFEDLNKIWLNMQFRSHPRGDNIRLVKYTRFPDHYKAAELQHGVWSSPRFDCGGVHSEWLVRYAAPFFGWDQLRHDLELKGMVVVAMRFKRLNVNQCDHDFWAPNAFKNTHKCDQRSTYCVPIQGREFQSGSYKCECRQGYEFPFGQELHNYFDGDLVESEFDSMLNNKSTIFDYLTCRLAGCCGITANCTLILCLLSLSLLALLSHTHAL